MEILSSVIQSVSAQQAWHYEVVPYQIDGNTIFLYCNDESFNVHLSDELEVILGRNLVLTPITKSGITSLLSKYYRQIKNEQANKTFAFGVHHDDLFDRIVSEAIQTKSSDIHFESYEDVCRVRMRIDGRLIERYVLAKSDYPMLINKIKIKSNLDIAEKRLPQDGRILMSIDSDKVDIRVSVLPTLYGEKVVLRLLSKDTTNIELSKLGFSSRQLADYSESIKKTSGIILISGPTGSGKTTTLYGTLKLLNQTHSNIITIEDPIEYTLDGVNQVQLNDAIGLDFSRALRSFLRQDPDIIMLGEIRDSETAQMAVRAALTGHLVFSTIHTNSAWGTVSRLIDMGVPPFLLSSTMILTVSQRLVRVLCHKCKEPISFSDFTLPTAYIPATQRGSFHRPVGCTECFYTGYKGRTAVYEVIPFDNELSGYVKNHSYDVNEALAKREIVRLSDAAYACFVSGETSLDEIYPILINSL